MHTLKKNLHKYIRHYHIGKNALQKKTMCLQFIGGALKKNTMRLQFIGGALQKNAKHNKAVFNILFKP